MIYDNTTATYFDNDDFVFGVSTIENTSPSDRGGKLLRSGTQLFQLFSRETQRVKRQYTKVISCQQQTSTINEIMVVSTNM